MMKTQIKLTALVLALVMLMGISFGVSAETPVKLEVKLDGDLLPGETVTAYVCLTATNVKALMLSPSCEADFIEISEAKWIGTVDSEAVLKENWDGENGATMAFTSGKNFADAAVLEITFTIDENADFGEEFVLDCVDVSVALVDGGNENSYVAAERPDVVTIVPFNGVIENTVLYGDVNGDGAVNAKDRTFLARYLTTWTGYDETVVVLANADVNADGVVNAKDRTILARHLTNWTGYETLPCRK